MAIKSLTVTEDAYDALKELKQDDESFSEVILRIRTNYGNCVEKFFGALQGTERETQEWIGRIKKEKAALDKELLIRQKKMRSTQA